MKEIFKHHIFDSWNRITVLIFTGTLILCFLISPLIYIIVSEIIYGAIYQLNKYFETALIIFTVINTPFLFIWFFSTISGIFKKRDDIDSEFEILFNFMLKYKLSREKKTEYLSKMFSSQKLLKINKLYDKFENKETSVYKACKNLINKPAASRIFVIYSLFDIASLDNIFSTDEEDYIKKVSDLLRIPKSSYKTIKNNFINKGLNDEQKLKEEEQKRKTQASASKLFFPYQAYKLLGVSPGITKEQLKKVYRTLAKKYHPDKYHGQSEEKIKAAEDKFQEITQAYEIILMYKTS